MAVDTLSLSIVVAAETAADRAAVDRLNERAFGPGRFARTAYRLREAGRGLPAGLVEVLERAERQASASSGDPMLEDRR